MKIKNYTNFINLTILVMLLFFLIKSLSVLFYSSRDITLGFPFDSFGFEPFHRFTDYLLIWNISRLENIYDLSAPLYSQIAPAPYGWLQFMLLKLVPFPDLKGAKYINFLLLVLILTYVNFKIYIQNNLFKNITKLKIRK